MKFVENEIKNLNDFITTLDGYKHSLLEIEQEINGLKEVEKLAFYILKKQDLLFVLNDNQVSVLSGNAKELLEFCKNNKSSIQELKGKTPWDIYTYRNTSVLNLTTSLIDDFGFEKAKLAVDHLMPDTRAKRWEEQNRASF